MTVLSAPAKLTLSLRITGVREDGYHLLEAEMVAIDLVDSLEVTDGDGLDVTDEIAWVGSVGDDAHAVPTSSSNLVGRALQAAERRARVRLTKRIPPGAGLGGGSSDAAAILRWAGRTDPAVAVGLGADVPFSVSGGRARVRGIGEELEPLPQRDRVYLLVTPCVLVKTPAVYAAWDELGGPAGDAGNDLEPAALAVEPGLRWWRDLMAAAVGERPRLAGSGGTWFVEGLAPESERLEELAAQIRAEVVGGREAALVTVARPFN